MEGVANLGLACMAALLPAVLLPRESSAQEVRLSGRILDRANLKPVPGALVHLAASPSSADTTGPDGRFSIFRIPNGLHPIPGRTPGTDPAAIPGLAATQSSANPFRNALGRFLSPSCTLTPWRPSWIRPAAPMSMVLAKQSASADRLEISRPGLLSKSLDILQTSGDLGDIVLDYPARRVGVGAPPIYGSVVLFDGTRRSLDAEWEHWMGTWRLRNGLAPTPITWTLVDDPEATGQVMRTCCRLQWGDEDLVTKRKFRDFQVHLEFNLVSPPRTGGTHPGPANSGVYLQSLYEIQIKDDYGKQPLGNHDAGGILNETAAPVNLGKPRGQWQAYDITFRAARFQGGTRVEKARLTMHWNGELVHRDRMTANEHAVGVSSDSLSDGPKGFKLQSEGHDVRFRNIWIKELELTAPSTDLGY